MSGIGWPQVIYVGLTLFSLGIAVEKHGTLRSAANSRHDAWENVVSILIVYPILWWGGFFG